MSLVGAGVRPKGLNLLTCSKLLKVIVLPRCLYGCELWNQLPKSCSLQLEGMLRFCCKVIQGFSKQVRSDKVTSMLGLPSIQAVIDKLKLCFFRRLRLLPGNLVVKQIFTMLVVQHCLNPHIHNRGFISDIFTLKSKYNLSNLISFNAFLDQISFDKHTWEGTVISHIVDYENDRYHERTSRGDRGTVAHGTL